MGPGDRKKPKAAADPKPAPPVLKKTAVDNKVTDEDNYRKKVFAEAGKSDANGDGKYDTVKAGAGIFSASERSQDGLLGGESKGEILTARGEAFASGRGFTAEGKAVVASGELSSFVGPRGDDGKNPYFELGAGGDVLGAEAKVDSLEGSDGKRVGFVKWVKAGASVATGWLKGRIGIPLGKYSIDIKVSVSADVAAVGAEVGGGGYYDKEEERVHLVGGVGLEAVLGGLGLNVDISAGKKFR